MGIFSSILMPLLKAGAVIGAGAIPGAGPILAPIVGGALTAGQSALAGQGPLTSLTQGAISGGMSAGMGALGDWMKGPGEGVADTSGLGSNVSFADPNYFTGGTDPLTQWAQKNLMDQLAQNNSFTKLYGGF